MSVSSVSKQRIMDEANGVFSRLSEESASRALDILKAIEVKFIPVYMLAWVLIIKLRQFSPIFYCFAFLHCTLQLGMFHKYEFYLRPSITLSN